VSEDALVYHLPYFYFLSLPLWSVFSVYDSVDASSADLASLIYVANITLVRDSLRGLTEPAAGFLLLLLCSCGIVSGSVTA